ncbi:hypothetical protein ACP275_03G062800 [Erythranthe tilingii]
MKGALAWQVTALIKYYFLCRRGDGTGDLLGSPFRVCRSLFFLSFPSPSCVNGGTSIVIYLIYFNGIYKIKFYTGYSSFTSVGADIFYPTFIYCNFLLFVGMSSNRISGNQWVSPQV